MEYPTTAAPAILRNPPRFLFRCPQGHEFVNVEKFSLLHFNDSHGVTADTGPLCLVCLCAHLKTRFPAEMVGSVSEDPQPAASAIPA